MTRPAMYEKYVWLADAVAKEFYLPGSDSEDVRQEARIGLWVATGAWDSSRGAGFRTFAAIVIRRRIVTAVKQARAGKHMALTSSVRDTVTMQDGDPVSLFDAIAGGRDPADIVVDREELARLADGIRRLSPIEREALLRVANFEHGHTGIGGNKRLDNALQRARRKLRAAA